ncbi:MAG: hypothetical protein CHACPFDD_00057 [Phycisphaerae bacterium]|nr:hypothetical protein [Phycisphaerae bacterium]
MPPTRVGDSDAPDLCRGFGFAGVRPPPGLRRGSNGHDARCTLLEKAKVEGREDAGPTLPNLSKRDVAL